MRMPQNLAFWPLAAACCLLFSNHAQAQLAFNPPNIDLGEVKAGQVFAQQVKVTNTGNEPIAVSELKSSCGCIQPVLEPSTLAPGASGTLKMQINTLASNPGPTTYGVRLRYQLHGQLREQLYVLVSNVVQEIVVTPAALTFIGERPRPQVLTIFDKRSTPIQLVGLETTSPFLAVEWVQPAQADPQPQYALYLTVRDGLPAGQHDWEIVVHTKDPAYPALRIPVKITKKTKARYVASPILVSLAPGVAPSRVVTIRDQQGEGVTIERFEASPGLTVAMTNQAVSSVTFNVSLDPAQKKETPFDGEVKAYLKGMAEPIKVLVNVD
jgi:hypothetical protein